MRLATTADVLLSMGIGSTAGSIESAGRALDLSFPIIESVLETRFEKASVVDFFTVGTSSRQFRLSNIFIDPDSLVVRVRNSSDPLFDTDDGDVVASSEYSLSAGNSVLAFRHTPVLGEHSLSVGYDYGLMEGAESTLLAPYWLKEAAIAMAVFVLNTHPSSPANRKEKTVTNVAASLRSLASELLNPYRRPRLCVDFPKRTVYL